MSDQLQIRVHHPAARPTLVYLPGLHGDGTLIAGFRQALGGRVRFVELAYPHTLTWSLDQHAAAVEGALAEYGIASGWLLGESFGSQVVWPLTARAKFQVEGVILAGGFVRHPVPWGAGVGGAICRRIPLGLIKAMFWGYGQVSRLRFRDSPETLRGIQNYVAGLNEQCRLAAAHRLDLVAQNDPCSIARELSLPLYALSGFFDPIVPWFWVRKWLREECPALRDYRMLWLADHNVLGTASAAAAEQILKWVTQSP